MIDKYIEAGWQLVPLPARCKGPVNVGWNQPENALKSVDDLPNGHGVGLIHALSGTCAIDIDHLELATAWLAERGVNLQDLLDAPDAVQIISGRQNSGKLLYRVPLGMPIPSKKVIIDKTTAIEFRCATADGRSVQDVIPPSIHPNDNIYAWGGRGSWQHLPELPYQLLSIWQELLHREEPRDIPMGRSTPATLSEIRSALFSIDASGPREQWIEVMFALEEACRTAGQPEMGFQLFDEWSATSETKYPGPKETAYQWKTAKPVKQGITAGTLFHHAFAAGWSRPVPDLSTMFQPIPKKQEFEEVKEILSPEAKMPECDLSLWPEQLLSRASEVAKEVGCDVIVPLLAGLSAVSAAADKRIGLQITNTWRVPPTVWLMTLGEPADKKTPGSKPMFRTLKVIEAEHRDRYEAELLVWKGMEAKHAAQFKHYREWAASPENDMPNVPAPEVMELPPQPETLRLIITDSTTQKMVSMAAGRPRGFLLWLDEMNKWLTRLSDRSSTDDRGSWIQGYETGPYTMDRMGAGSIHADNLALSIYGNCQPEVFRRNVADGSSDGLMQRFMPVMLNAKKNAMWQHPVPDFMSSEKEYDTLIRRTFALPQFDYILTPDAMAIFRKFSEWALEIRSLERLVQRSDAYNTALGKAEGNCARIILLFHLILEPYSPFVSEDTAWRAIALYQQFMFPSMRHVFLEVANERSKVAESVFDFVIQQATVKPIVTMGELRRAARYAHGGGGSSGDRKSDQEILVAMDELVDLGYAWVHQDHPRNPTFAINASIASVFSNRRRAIIGSKQAAVERLRQSVRVATGKEARIGNVAGLDTIL